MTDPDETFQNVIKINKIRTKPRVRLQAPTSGYNRNFEEFRSVYGSVLSRKVKRVSSKNVVRVISSPKFGNCKYKPELKLVQLEMPVLGTEQAIVGPPKKKILRTKSILKKSTSEPKGILKNDFVSKLKQIEKEEPIQNKSSKDLKTSTFLEAANNEVSIAEKQLQQIKNLLMKRHGEKSKVKRPTTPLYRKNIPSRHSACFKKNYFSTLSSMKEKLKELEQKYFSKPQIVYKSVNDNFTQSSDIKILYENTHYPEDLKLDQALKGIINELDDLANINVEDQYLAPIDNEQKKSIAALIKESEEKVEKNKVLKEEIMNYLLKNKSHSNVILEEQDSKHNPFTSDSFAIRKNIRGIIDSGTNVMGFKKDMEEDEIDYESKRSVVPRNLTFMKSFPKCAKNKHKTLNVDLIDSQKSFKNKKAMSKVRFDEQSKTIPANYDNKSESNDNQISDKIEKYLKQLRHSTEQATKYIELTDNTIKDPIKSVELTKTTITDSSKIDTDNPERNVQYTTMKAFNCLEDYNNTKEVKENIEDGLDSDYSGVDEILAKYGFKRDTTGTGTAIPIDGDMSKNNKQKQEAIENNLSVSTILEKYGYRERDFDFPSDVSTIINSDCQEADKINKNAKQIEENPQSNITDTVNSADSVFTLIDDTRLQLQEFALLQQQFRKQNYFQEDIPRNRETDENAKGEMFLNEIKHQFTEDKRRKGRNALSFKTNFHNTMDDTNEFKDIIAETIDKSEARLKQLRNIKNDLYDVNQIYDEIAHITDEEDNSEENVIDKTKEVKEGTGDESGLFEGTNLQKGVMNSCYLMKEFNIQPSVKFFSHNNSIVPSRQQFRETTEKCTQSSVINVQKLKKSLDVALQNSLFSFSDEKK